MEKLIPLDFFLETSCRKTFSTKKTYEGHSNVELFFYQTLLTVY